MLTAFTHSHVYSWLSPYSNSSERFGLAHLPIKRFFSKNSHKEHSECEELPHRGQHCATSSGFNTIFLSVQSHVIKPQPCWSSWLYMFIFGWLTRTIASWILTQWSSDQFEKKGRLLFCFFHFIFLQTACDVLHGLCGSPSLLINLWINWSLISILKLLICTSKKKNLTYLVISDKLDPKISFFSRKLSSYTIN